MARPMVAILMAGLFVVTPVGSPRAAPATAAGEEQPSAGTVSVIASDGDTRTAADALVETMSTREKAASVVMGHIPTTDPAALREYMSGGFGGFILMGANIPATEDRLREVTAALTADASLPPLIGIDEEGGDVARLPWDTFPASTTLKFEEPAATEEAFAARAALVQRSGANVNFGIVADVPTSSSSFIYRRALGTDPASSADHVAAAVRGEGVEAASTLKHFPGHGTPAGDSHRGIPSTDMSYEQWIGSDARPFAAGIDAGAPLLMYGHLRYTAVDSEPASLSATWHEIARDELGFDGVAITDDMGMLQASGESALSDPVVNAVRALQAGNDMVLIVLSSTAQTAPAIVDGVIAAVEDGSLDSGRLDEAAQRVAALRLQLAAEGRGLVPCDACEPAE